MDKTVICMKWGDRYGPEYVNRLYRGVTRNITGPLRFVCFTDDPAHLHQGIEIQPLPAITLPEPFTWTPWRKLSCWQYPLAGLEGDILFLDIDLVITGMLDDLFAFAPGEYCVIENWTQKGRGIGNTSACRFPAGKYAGLYEIFEQNPMKVLERHRIEQHYISRYIPNQRFWPSEWCVSFKHDLVPPFPFNWTQEPVLTKESRLVAFTGRPDPDEAAAGIWPAPWYKRFYKHARPARWIADYWRE